MTEQEKCDQWNRENQTGVCVDIRYDNNKTVRTRTNSAAEIINGMAVVRAEKLFLYYPLNRVTRVPFASDEDFNYDRAGGDCICEACGKKFYDHPDDLDHPSYDGIPGLRKLCSGRLVKL